MEKQEFFRISDVVDQHSHVEHLKDFHWELLIVQRIIVKKWLDRSLFDKSMKFGTVVVHSITKDIRYDAK